MSHINYDRRAADKNADRAQQAFLSASYREQVAKAANAANLRAAVLSGLAIGVLGAAASIFFGV